MKVIEPCGAGQLSLSTISTDREEHHKSIASAPGSCTSSALLSVSRVVFASHFHSWRLDFDKPLDFVSTEFIAIVKSP